MPSQAQAAPAAREANPARPDEMAEVRRLAQERRFDAALQKLDALIAAKPRDAQLRFNRGVILAESGKVTEAIQTYEVLAIDFPELPEPYNNVAVLYASQGQYEKAKLALEMAIRNRPDYGVAQENLGDVLAKMAALAYEKALKSSPNSPVIRGKFERARELFMGVRPAAVGQLDPVGGTASQHASPSANLSLPPAGTPNKAAAPLGALGALESGTAVVSSTTAPTPLSVQNLPDTGTVIRAGSGTDNVTRPSSKTAINHEMDNVVAGEVLAVVQDWAKVWSSRQADKHLAYYAPSFTPSTGQSRSVWLRDRRDSINLRKSIEVKIDETEVNVQESIATVKFRQTYSADHINTVLRKTLVLEKNRGKWLIIQEFKS